MNLRRQAQWLWLALLVVVLDQGSKLWVESAFLLYEILPVFPGFNLRLHYNPGAAFGFLSDQGGWQRWFFSLLALLVSGGLVVWLLRLSRSEWVQSAAITLIIGGAVGNLIDRIAYGHVVDFLDFYVARYHWPTFNLADAAITLGVGLMLYDTLLLEPKRNRTEMGGEDGG